MAQMADMKWFNMATNMVVIGGKIRKTVDQGIGKKTQWYKSYGQIKIDTEIRAIFLSGGHVACYSIVVNYLEIE